MMYALFTDIDMAEVRKLIAEDIVKAKKMLSYEITKFIQGEEAANLALKTAQEIFEGAGKSETMNTVVYDKLNKGVNICEMLADVGICASRGEARRLIAQAGISLDGKKIADDKLMLNTNEIVVSKGKKIHLKVVCK